MLPVGWLTVVVAITPRTSSRLIPIAASLAGSTCTRTAGFCAPPIPTSLTPGICEICCARIVSAYSLTRVSGSVSDCTASTRIATSAGLVLRKVGGLGKLVGNWPLAAVIADCTSSAAASILRLRSNCSVIWVEPSALLEVICDRPEISENWRSSGCATLDAIVSGLAPGRLAETWMVGKSTCGSGATGSSGHASTPVNMTASASSEVPIGRLINAAEMLIVSQQTLHLRPLMRNQQGLQRPRRQA